MTSSGYNVPFHPVLDPYDRRVAWWTIAGAVVSALIAVVLIILAIK